MIYFADFKSGGLRLITSTIRQIYLLALALHLPNEVAADLFKILALNSIFSLLIGGEKYYRVINGTSTKEQIIANSILSSVVYFPVYYIIYKIFISPTAYDWLGYILIFFTASLFDALANNEQKIHNFHSTGPYDDLALNIYRNIVPVLLAILINTLYLNDWLVSTFMASSLLCIRYIKNVFNFLKYNRKIKVFTYEEFYLMGSSLAYRSNVFFDRILLNMLGSDALVVAGSLAQSSVSTIGGIIDMTYTRRISTPSKSQMMEKINDCFVRAHLNRLMLIDFIRAAAYLFPLWLALSAAIFLIALTYKNEPLSATAFLYFLYYFVFQSTAHFVGIFSIKTSQPKIGMILPITRLFLIIAGIIFTLNSFFLFSIFNLMPFLILIYLVCFGASISPLRFSTIIKIKK